MRRPKLGSIYRRGEVWWVKYYRNGQPFRESSHSENYADAERLLKRRQGEIVSGRFAGLGPERVRVGQLSEAVIEDYTSNHRRSLNEVQIRISLHLTPAFGAIHAADFSTLQVKRYIANRQEAGAANATINRELAIVRRAFTLAAQADPPRVARVPYIPSLVENNVRKGFLEHSAYQRLRDELPDYLRLLFVVAYHSGARRAELTRIQWSQVDFISNRITLNPGETKNDEPRTLPVYGEMREWLLMTKEVRDLNLPDCPWVFHENGRRIQTFRRAWSSACDRAAVPGLLFHDLRRSAVRNMVRAGIPEKVAMAISGHKTQSVFQRYNIVSEQDLLDAAAKMERHLQSLGTVLGTVEQKGGEAWGRTDRKLLN